MFLNWKERLTKMNQAIEKAKQKTRQFTKQEFLVGLGLIIGAAEFAQNGKELFQKSGVLEPENENWNTLTTHPHFEKHMSLSRFKEFRKFLPSMYVDETKIETDPWYQFSGAVDEFNMIRRKRVVASSWISADESMSAWKPRTTDKGGLPNISFIVRKPKPLGTEFKSTACPITGVLRCLEIQRGKQGMMDKKYNMTIGATAGCTLRLAEDTIAEDDIGMTHGIRADAWFGSVKTASELAIRGFECVLQIKQYHSLFPKDYIDDALKEAPGGIAIFLEGKAPNEVPLIAIGYHYSRKIILHFIATKKSGSTAEGFPHQSKYTNDYDNVHQCKVE